MAKNRTRPAKEFRLGHVKATVWANPQNGTVRHNVTLAKLYKDGAVWKTTSSFGRDDLPLVSRVAEQAHSWILLGGRQVADSQGEKGQETREEPVAEDAGYEASNEG